MMAAGILLALGAMAQDKKDNDSKGSTLRESYQTDDTTGVYCATMKGDNIVMNGENENMSVDSKKLPNGSVLFTDGVIKRKDGSYYSLKEGECLNKKGEVLHRTGNENVPKRAGETNGSDEPKSK
jgi:hypothetical protein